MSEDELRKAYGRAVTHSTEMEARAWKCEHERDVLRTELGTLRAAAAKAFEALRGAEAAARDAVTDTRDAGIRAEALLIVGAIAALEKVLGEK